VKPVLLAESSQTRRRALSSLLAQHGFGVTAVANLDEAYAYLQKMNASTAHVEAVILGWPEYADGVAEDVFGLLHGERFEHLPVLVMADSTSAAAVNWRMARPRSALVLWSDYLEVGAALEALVRPAETARPNLGVGGPALRVLFVDDSATIRVGFSKLLDKQGYLVETANSVKEGWERAQALPFDIAIVDYLMPEQNGTALIKMLREDPDTSHILCATITGTYSDGVIAESLNAGAVECLFKSEAKELLLARIASLARTINDGKAIDRERRRLQGILSSVGDGVYGVDADGIIQFINPAALELLCHSRDQDLVGRSAFETIHHSDEDGSPMSRSTSYLSQCYAAGSDVTALQTVFWTAQRRCIPVECTVHPLRMDGERIGSVVAFRDVSARRRLEEELRWQAEHDGLTKLHNRIWFEAQLEQEISRLRRSGQTSLLLFIDLDRFKYINDTAGHSAGDRLLVEVSQRLQSRLRGADHLARMGGDEFAVLLTNVSASDLPALADGFRKALTAMPFTYGGKSYRITLSIGASRLDSTTLSPSEAMAHADIGCHIAKNAGRNQVHVYTDESGRQAAMDVDLGWSVRLEEALRTDRFALCYQPIVPLKGIEYENLTPGVKDLWLRQLERNPDSPALFEVLIRLRDSAGELVSPAAFLPAAERFGMMADIDRWMIDHALKAMREVRNSSRPVALTLNVSAQTLEKGGLPEFVTAKIVEHDVNPGALVFEITESHSITDLGSARKQLHALRQLGCLIAVDDFGTGFSTFAYLRQLEADLLKIDGSLIQGLPDDPLDRVVIAALTSISETAGKRTIAECVEDPAMLMSLYECGVDFVQGYVIGMPRMHLYLAMAALNQAPPDFIQQAG
jgi:diguanylate cyclase (GGDEF)-like protein/PAS domain S-box-containing protein